jgi:hypothetical protein
VPDFTDPERRAGLTVEDYFEVITNGRIDKLMPPWKDALSEEERWAVAEFAYSLAGDAQVAVVETPSSDGTSVADNTPEADVTAASNETLAGQHAGAYSGDWDTDRRRCRGPDYERYGRRSTT